MAEIEEKNNRLAYILALITALLWGTSAAASKLALNSFSFWNVQFYTLGLSSIFLLLLIFIQKKSFLLGKIKVIDLFWMLLIGFLGKFMYDNLFYFAIGRLPTQEAFIINYLWPMMVVISAIFILKEKLTPIKIISLIISFFAIVIVATKGDILALKFSDNLGVLSAVLGAIAYGVYSALSKKRGYDPLVGNFMFTLSSFIFTAISIPFFDNLVSVNFGQFLGLFWLGPILSFGAVLWLLALKIGDTSKVSNLIYFTPLFSLVYISLLLGEKITISSILGLLLLVASNLVLIIKIPKKIVS